MATLDQLAEGIAKILGSGAAPNPLAIDLKNHLPAEASHLVKTVIRECKAAGVALTTVRIDPSMAADLQALEAGEAYVQEGVSVVLDPLLGRRVEFYREG